MLLFPFVFNKRQTPPAQPQRLCSLELKNAAKYLFTNEMAARLWSAPGYLSGGRDDITDFHGRADFRLKAWLRESARMVLDNGRLVERVPHVVIIGLPESLARIDQENGGVAAYTMKENLIRLHREEQGGAEEAVFIVLPHGGLSDRVYFWCGATVFAPREGEQPVESLSVSLIGPDGREEVLPEPQLPIQRLVGNELIPDSRPAGRFAGQRLLHLGGALGQASIILAKWFGGGTEGWIFIDLEAHGEAAHGRGDGKVVAAEGRLTVDAPTGVRRWVFTAAQPADRPGDQPEQLIVTLTPLPGARSALPDPIPGPTTAMARPTADVPAAAPLIDAEGRGTIIVLPRLPLAPEGALEEPAEGFLDIVAIDLLRIDGHFTLPGLEDWRLLFDAEGRLVDSPGPDRLRLGGRSTSDTLFAGLPGQAGWIPITTADGPVDLKLAGGDTVSVHPPARPAGSFGLLRLRRPIPVALPAGRGLVIGRRDGRVPDQGPDRAFDRIIFDLLDRPGSLTFANDAAATLEQVGLSRRHLRARIVNDRLHLSPFESRAAVWHLDPAGAVVGALNPGSGGTLVLESGDGLLVGGYLTRFRLPTR